MKKKRTAITVLGRKQYVWFLKAMKMKEREKPGRL
jgi:hypothetical protein